MKKYLFLVVFCLLLASYFSTCSAAYQISEDQLTKLETNSAMLREKINLLENKLTQSQTDCTTLKMELEGYQLDLNNLQKKSEGLILNSETLKANLEACQKSLTKTTEYINQYEKQVKAKIRKLTFERDIVILYFIYDKFIRK